MSTVCTENGMYEFIKIYIIYNVRICISFGISYQMYIVYIWIHTVPYCVQQEYNKYTKQLY
jgi:hypothetical protein